MGEQIGTCLHADLPRETLPQLLRAQQIGPLLCRPRPEVAPQLAAAVQHDRGGVAGEPPLEHGVGMPVQHRQRLVQWRGQSQNRLPLPVFAVPVEPQQVETESLQRIGFVLRTAVLADGNDPAVQRPLPSRCPACAANSRSSSSATGLLLAEAGQHLHPPGVDVVHAASELVGQLPSGQVDIGERGLGAAMSGERGDRV